MECCEVRRSSRKHVSSTVSTTADADAQPLASGRSCASAYRNRCNMHSGPSLIAHNTYVGDGMNAEVLGGTCAEASIKPQPSTPRGCIYTDSSKQVLRKSTRRTHKWAAHHPASPSGTKMGRVRTPASATTPQSQCVDGSWPVPGAQSAEPSAHRLRLRRRCSRRATIFWILPAVEADTAVGAGTAAEEADTAVAPGTVAEVVEAEAEDAERNERPTRTRQQTHTIQQELGV
jgi:hypothetical protein